MASNNSPSSSLAVSVAPSSSVPPSVTPSNVNPVRRSARVLKKTANAEDAKKIDRQLTSLYGDRYDHNGLAFPHFKAASEVTANFYEAQDSALLSIPAEIRASIFKLALDGANEDKPENVSFVRLPKLVLTCKQFLTEVPSIFYRVNTFTFAVGSNWTYFYALNESDPTLKWARSRSGTLGLNPQQSKAASAGVSEIRLHAFTFRIFSHFHIDRVQQLIAACRKGNKVKRPGFECAAQLTIAGGKLILEMRHSLAYQNSRESKEDVNVMRSAIQSVVDELNEREDLKRGLDMRDVMRLAAALRF
jgi:hypothetical protein